MSADILKKYEDNGFVVITPFLSSEEVDILKKEGKNLIKNMPEQTKRTIFNAKDGENSYMNDKYFIDSAHDIGYFYESGAIGANGELLVEKHISLNKIGHALHTKNVNFKKITFDDRIKDICRKLGYKDPGIVQSMYICKNPGLGSEVNPHQDSSYLYTEPESTIGFWIALEDATIENGCLRFMPGSHKNGIDRRFLRNSDKTSKTLIIYDSPSPDYDKNKFVATPVPKGSCILIHGKVLHYSEPNKSDKSRHVYTFHIVEQHETTYSDQNWIQPIGNKFISVYDN